MPEREMPEVAGAEVEHEWVQLGETRLHVATGGAPDATPLLCVHGWPQHWYMWRHQIPPLADRFRVICPDLRGFGWSGTPGHGYDAETFASDLLALLDALEIERAPILAHDWGGFSAYLLAARHPDRVERLLTLNIVPPFVRSSPRAMLQSWRFIYQLAAASPLGPAMMRGLDRPTGRLRRRLLGSPDWSAGAGASYADQFREPGRARAGQLLYRHALGRMIPRIVAGHYAQMSITRPCRLLFGTRDLSQPPALLESIDDRDDIELIRVAGAHHFIAEERPELVTEQALEFLAD